MNKSFSLKNLQFGVIKVKSMSYSVKYSYLSLIGLIFIFFTPILPCKLSAKIGHAQKTVQKTVAIFELSNPAGLSEQEIKSLTTIVSDILTQELVVLDRKTILDVIPPNLDLQSCVGACAFKTGQLLKADYIITGDIFSFSNQLRMTIKVHDVNLERLYKSEVARGKEFGDLKVALQETAKKLLLRLTNKSKKAILEVSVVPKNLIYKINEEIYEQGLKHEVTVGKTYQVVSIDPCYEDLKQEINASERNETLKVHLEPQKAYTTLDIQSLSQDGKPIDADVFVDDQKLGKTPRNYEVLVCSKTLRLSNSEYGNASQELNLSKGTTENITLTLETDIAAKKRLYTTYMWSATALAVTAITVSLYGYLQADSIKASYDPYYPRNNYVKFNEYKELADSGARGALLSSGVALFFYFAMPNPQLQKQTGLSLTREKALATYTWTW